MVGAGAPGVSGMGSTSTGVVSGRDRDRDFSSCRRLNCRCPSIFGDHAADRLGVVGEVFGVVGVDVGVDMVFGLAVGVVVGGVAMVS